MSTDARLAAAIVILAVAVLVLAWIAWRQQRKLDRIEASWLVDQEAMDAHAKRSAP